MQLEYQQKLDIFSQLFELSTDAIFIWKLEGEIVFWSPGAQKLYGYSEEDAIGASAKTLLKTDFTVPDDDIHNKVFKQGRWEGDVNEVTKCGKKLIVSSRLQVITVADEQVVLVVNRDVTRERESVQQISTQAELLQLCPDAIIVLLAGKEVSYWNKGAERLYGYTEQEIVGQTLLKLLESKYPLPYEEMLMVLERDGEWQGDVHERTKSGEQIVVSSHIQRYQQNGSDFYLIANRGVTAQRLLQGEVVALNQGLVISNRELDEFSYIASHDLKEPIRGISINADILLREELPESVAIRVRRMAVLCEHVDKLITDLLYFSRLGRPDKKRSTIDINKTIGAVRTKLRDVLTNVNGVVTIDTDLPLVDAEPVKVNTVFYNLILNAVTYNRSSPRSVNVGFLPSVLVDGVEMQNVFYVSDNGIGIDIKHRGKIFHIFRRLVREADYGSGTGAGLSFVKKIIEGYGGEITTNSDPGQGTTFYFSLPLYEKNTLQFPVREDMVSHG